MINRHYNLLFLCWDNATYSPVAESLINRWSDDQFIANSAGLHPALQMDPLAHRFLREKSLPHPDHVPQPVEMLKKRFDYIFLLDERIPHQLFSSLTLPEAHIVDWKLPVAAHTDWQQMKEYYAVLEHRVRMLACTLYGLEDGLLYQRMDEIALFNNTAKMTRNPGLDP
jgi:protein-tyrosine-phosphatase